jgi:predicted flavoprotein YhiN
MTIHLKLLLALYQVTAIYQLCWALSPPSFRIAIIGGGSSGVMAASSIKKSVHRDVLPSVDITVYESTKDVLRNIRNHHQDGILYDASKTPMDVLNAGYPRGRKEITSLMTKYFPPMQQQKWFEDRGVEFRTRQDGTMTCSDGNASPVISALLDDQLRETIETNARVVSISKDDETGCFQLSVNGRREIHDCVILATGNSYLGFQLAKSLGHTITKPVRSCFELVLKDSNILSSMEEGGTYDLPYVRLSYKVAIKGQKRPRIIRSEGPARLQLYNSQVLLTGIAALSLSSAAAFELKDATYKGTLWVHFCPDHLGGKVENIEQFLWQYRQDNPNEIMGERCPLQFANVDYDEYDWETESFKSITTDCIPRNLWRGLVQESGMAYDSTWSKVNPKKCRKLAESMVGCSLEFRGRNTCSMYPFIDAGGTSLNEVDMNSMQSKVVDGLFLCGQVLDGDASHSCFSFMRDLATGKMAGESAVLYAKEILLSKNNNITY